MAAGDFTITKRDGDVVEGFIETNGTAAVTFKTGLGHIKHVQLTWREAPDNADTSVLYVDSLSGGNVLIKSAAASGAKTAYVYARGYN